MTAIVLLASLPGASHLLLAAPVMANTPVGWWAIYAGGVAYLTAGTLVVAEYLFRRWYFRASRAT